MRQLFSAILIALAVVSCNNSKTTNQDSSSDNKKVEVKKDDTANIIQKVKDKEISKKFTAGAILDSIAGDDGIVSWQIHTPKEYENDKDIVGVLGSTEVALIGGKTTFKVLYIYQKSTEKIMYYAGEWDEKSIQEYDLIIKYEEMKVVRDLF